MACSPDLIDVRKCTVPTSQSSTSLNPAVLGCSFKQFLCDADPGLSHQQYLTDDEQIYVQWEDDKEIAVSSQSREEFCVTLQFSTARVPAVGTSLP